MDSTILTALITSCCTLAVCLINNYFQNKASEKKYNDTVVLMEYKLGELTKAVEKHNGVIERVYLLEKHEAIYDEKIDVINHRLKDLETESHE